MERRTAGQAIVDVLSAEGVRHVFGLPGGHVLSIYDGLYAAPEIEHVLARHEQIAASMAAGYAQLTGEPGVCLVTAGPGCTNMLTAVAEAYVGCLPMVLLAGRGATATAQRGASQEVATDQIFAPVTKWAVRVDRPDLVVRGHAPRIRRGAQRQTRPGVGGPAARRARQRGRGRRIRAARAARAAARRRGAHRAGGRRPGGRLAAAPDRGRRRDRLRRRGPRARARRAACDPRAHQPVGPRLDPRRPSARRPAGSAPTARACPGGC